MSSVSVRDVVAMIPALPAPLRTLAFPVLLCAGLAGGLVLEVAGSSSPSPPPAVTPPSRSAAPAEAATRFTLPPLDSFAEVIERPLFSSSRRPSATDTPQSTDRPFSATLAGIVISKKSSSIIVAQGDPSVLKRFKQGDEVDGWSIRAIEPNRVVLERRGVEQQIKLGDAPGRSAGETAPRAHR
jgi:type II secretory pathway component PulC